MLLDFFLQFLLLVAFSSSNHVYRVGYFVANDLGLGFLNYETDGNCHFRISVQGNTNLWSDVYTYVSGTTYFRQPTTWNYFYIATENL